MEVIFVKVFEELVILVENISVYDKCVKIDVIGEDKDNIMVKKDNKNELFVNVYKVDGIMFVKLIWIDGLLICDVFVIEFLLDLDYVVKVEGKYDLLDGKGEKDKVYFLEIIKIEKSLLSMILIDYLWNLVYG